jgi:hypothetical protein
MLVPLGHAQRNALVELIFGKALGRGVHHADQFVVIAILLLEQRRRMFGIEVKGGFHRVAIVSEVIHLLRNLRQEDLESIGERNMVILGIAPQRCARASSSGFGWRSAVIFMCGPMSMWPSIECMTCAPVSLSSLSPDIGMSSCSTYRDATFLTCPCPTRMADSTERSMALGSAPRQHCRSE